MTAVDGVPDPAPAPDSAPTRDERIMPLVDHLAELRGRLIWSVLAIIAGAVVGFAAADPIIDVLRGPLPANLPIIVTSIGDAFAIKLRIAIVAGIILAMPILLWHLWRFIAPGLTASERRAILPWIPAALAFFALGVGIAYIVMPFAAEFLLSFVGETLTPLISIREYLDFVTTLFLGFGILMEFPILLVGLSKVGIVTSERLRRARRMVILVIAIFAAVVTPGGDLVSPTALGLTLYVLFELTTFVIARTGR